MTDAVLAFWQNMEQEPADELGRCQRHGGVAVRAFETVVFNAKGDAMLIETDQAAVGYRDPVGVARQIRQHSFGSGEGFLGVDDSVDIAQWCQHRLERGAIGQADVVTKETGPPGSVQFGQPFQNEPPVKAGQHSHGEEEVLATGDPPGAIGRQSTTRYDHVDMGVVRHHAKGVLSARR